MLLANKVPISFVYRSIRADVLRVMAFSVTFHLIHTFIIEHLPEIPGSLPTILGTAISLLLGFNMSQSYERWWEARKIWGSIVNDSRSLVVQLQAFVVADEPNRSAADAVVRRMAHRQIVWCDALARSLRGQSPIDEAQGRAELLSAEDRAAAAAQANAPLALSQRQTADLRALHQDGLLNDYQQIQVDATLVRLVASMGMAERIKKTVFPATYSTFIHFFVYLFLIVLSMTLIETVGIIEIPILVLVASSFFMIESTARQLQDPFENKPYDIAMTSISRTVEINVRQLLGESEVPPPHPQDDFYLL